MTLLRFASAFVPLQLATQSTTWPIRQQSAKSGSRLVQSLCRKAVTEELTPDNLLICATSSCRTATTIFRRQAGLRKTLSARDYGLLGRLAALAKLHMRREVKPAHRTADRYFGRPALSRM